MKKIIAVLVLIALFAVGNVGATNDPSAVEGERIVLFTNAPQNWDRIERILVHLYDQKTQSFPTSFLSHLVCEYNPLEVVKEYLQNNSLDKGLCGDIFITYNRLGNVITKDDFLTRAPSGGLSFPVGRELEDFVVRIRGSEGSSEQRLKRLKTWAHQIRLSMDRPDPISVKVGPGGEGGLAIATVVPNPRPNDLRAVLARIKKLESQTVVTSGDLQEIEDLITDLNQRSQDGLNLVDTLISKIDGINRVLSDLTEVDFDWLPGFRDKTNSRLNTLETDLGNLKNWGVGLGSIVFVWLIILSWSSAKRKQQ